MPDRAGVISGLSFGMGGIGATLLGVLADRVGIASVHTLCSLLPLLGLLCFLLPLPPEQAGDDGFAPSRRAGR